MINKEKHSMNLNKKNSNNKNIQTYQISIMKYNNKKNKEGNKNNNQPKISYKISKDFNKKHKVIKSFDDKKNYFLKNRNKSLNQEKEKEKLNKTFSYKPHSSKLKKKINLGNLKKKKASKSHMNSIILEEQKQKEDKAILEAYYAKKLSLEKIDQESRFLYEDDDDENSISLLKNIIHDKETTVEDEEKNFNKTQKTLINIIERYFSRSRLQILEASYENKIIDVRILMYDFHILSEKIYRMKDYFQPFIITKIEKFPKSKIKKNEFNLIKSFSHYKNKEKRKNDIRVISTFYLPKVSISIDKKNYTRNKFIRSKNKSYSVKKEHKIFNSLSNIKSLNFERRKKTFLQTEFKDDFSGFISEKNESKKKCKNLSLSSKDKKDKKKSKIKKINSIIFNDINNIKISQTLFYFLNYDIKTHPLRNLNKIYRQIYLKECIKIIQKKILLLNNTKIKEKELLIKKENKLQDFLQNYL